MPFYGKRRANRKKTTKRTYKKRSGISANVKRYVKRTIHANIENKTEIAEHNLTITSHSQNTAMNAISCIPYQNIAHGTFQGSKLGNEIRTRKCVMRMVLTINPYELVYNSICKPQIVQIWVGKVKNARPQFPIASDFQKLFQTGDSSSPPQSSLLDLCTPLNKDYFTIYFSRKYKLGYSQSSQASGSAPSGNQYYSNNDYKLNHIITMNLTKHCPKLVRFNDGTLQPTNDGLFMWFQSLNADGSASDTPRPVNCKACLEYVFEDA